MVPEKIRNIVLVGHGGTGKTTLDEAFLFAAGVTTRMGRVEDGNTVSDFEPDEHERHISLNLAITPFRWEGCHINLIDTPGYPNFVGEAKMAMRAADLALFVVSAVDGVEVQHEILWRMAGEEGIARAFVINKLDRERADYAGTLAQIQEQFGSGVAPLHLPIGQEGAFNGIVDIVNAEAFSYDGSSPVGTKIEIPADLRDEEERLHGEMVEAVVAEDDEMLERYFEGEIPSNDTLVQKLHEGVVAGTTWPVLCASATQLVGIDLLANFFCRYAPTPLEGALPPVLEGSIDTSPDAPPVAYCFKTIADPYMGRVSLFRVYGGTIRQDEELVRGDGGGGGRMHNLFMLRGKEHEDVRELQSGDIAAIAKVEEIGPGDTLVRAGTRVVIAPVEMPQPVMSVAIFPKSQADEEKLSAGIQKIVESDPTLRIERRADTHEAVLSGLGDTHLDVAVARLKRRYGVEVETKPPTIAYRETIQATADVEGKHKKQSGGRGQYGVAFVKFEPLPPGSGFEYVNETVGGSIPRQFIPAVEKGIVEQLQRGILAGFPVVDVRATVYDGKYHAVDSDEMSFRLAGIAAVKAAADKLRPTLLEPVEKVRIFVPEAYMGDVIGDLNAKRGHVLGMDFEGDTQVVTAMVPAAELQRYAIELRSITHGRGTFESTFDHYAPVPAQEVDRIVQATGSPVAAAV